VPSPGLAIHRHARQAARRPRPASNSPQAGKVEGTKLIGHIAVNREAMQRGRKRYLCRRKAAGLETGPFDVSPLGRQNLASGRSRAGPAARHIGRAGVPDARRPLSNHVVSRRGCAGLSPAELIQRFPCVRYQGQSRPSARIACRAGGAGETSVGADPSPPGH